MKDLIEALQIFAKYKTLDNPTHCEHDELTVLGFLEGEVSKEDEEKLDALGFFWEEDRWLSFRYGSA